MKKREGVILLGIVLVIFAGLIFFKFTGNVIYNPPVGIGSSNCNSATASQIWDSIFKESSSGIITNITTSQMVNANCSFYSYKLVGSNLYYLKGYNTTSISQILFYLQANVENLTPEGLGNFSLLGISGIDPTIHTYNRSLSSSSDANSTFSSYFKSNIPDLSLLTLQSGGGINMYIYSEDTNSNPANSTDIHILANYSTQIFFYSSSFIKACIPDWTLMNNSCMSNERRNFYYSDAMGCRNASTGPANYTLGCDYNGDGLIGNFSGKGNFNLNVSITNLTSANDSRKVILKEGNKSIIEFSWNFSVPLDIQNLSITKETSGNFGYTIVNGLEVTKTVYVNILNSSSSLCIKDANVGSIDQISANCNSSGEIELECPGSSSSKSCSIEDGRFKITGLAHSAVKEFSSQSINCLQNWNCTSWSVCTNSIQNRLCFDANFCFNLTGKPSENQSCTRDIPIVPSCTPNWNCSSWGPENCIGNQTRTCSDMNSCGSESGKPEVERTCPEKKSYTGMIIIVIIVVLVLTIIASLYFIIFRHRVNEIPVLDNNKKQNPYGGSINSV